MLKLCLQSKPMITLEQTWQISIWVMKFGICNLEFQLIQANFESLRPRNGIPLTGRSMREAIDALEGNKEVPENQKPRVGCRNLDLDNYQFLGFVIK